VKAYLYTGRAITNGTREFEEVVPVGSYGYVVRHVGQTEDWEFRISGAERIDATTYLLRIPAGTTKRVTDEVKALEPPRLGFGLLGGCAIPLGALPGSYGVGPAGAISAAFNLGRDDRGVDYWVQALLGYDYLPAAGITPSAWHLGSATALFRVSFPFTKWLRPFLSVGGGVFLSAAGSIEGAAVVGTGLELAPWYSVHFQLGVDLFGNPNGVLAHAQGGVIYRLRK